MNKSLLFAAVCMMAASFVGSAAEKAPSKLVDATELTLINKPQTTSAPLTRVEVDKYPDLTPKVREYYDFSTGVAVAFRTNSPYINAQWNVDYDKSKGVNTTVISQKGLDLYIRDENGRWISAGFAKPKYVGKTHKSVVVENMDGEMKECVLYLPIFDKVTDLKLEVDSMAVIEPIANPFTNKRVIFTGSSITHGSGSSRSGMTYPARLERILNVEAPNLGASGQCKLELFFADVLADCQADAFVFDTFSNPTPEQIVERFEPFVAAVRKSHPTEPLIFLQTEVRESGNFDLKKRQFEADKREAARKVLADVMKKYDNVYFIDPGMPLGDDHEATVDGVHPTDLGYDRVVSYLAPKLREILGL